MFVDSSESASQEYGQFWRNLRAGMFQSGEFKRKTKDGREIWIHATYNPVIGKDGQPVKVIKHATDVTNQVEEREEAFKLRRIIEDSEAAFMMVNRDFVVTYINQATKDLLSKHEQTFRKMWPTFDSRNIIGTCIDQFHREPSHQRNLLSDPSRLPYQTDIQVGPLTIQLNITAVHDSQGDYVGNTLEWLDVTEERKQEARNADYEGQISAISKSMAVIEFQMDGTIVKANDNFLAVTGYHASEINGQHHRMFMPAEDSQSAEYLDFWTKLNRGEYITGEFRRVGKGGKEIWIRASYNPILDQHGAPTKVVKYASDITATKEMEKSIQQAQAKEQAEAHRQREKVAELLTVVNAVADGTSPYRCPIWETTRLGKLPMVSVKPLIPSDRPSNRSATLPTWSGQARRNLRLRLIKLPQGHNTRHPILKRLLPAWSRLHRL